MIEHFDYWAKVNDWIAHCHQLYAQDDLDAFVQQMEEVAVYDDNAHFLKLLWHAGRLAVYATSCLFANRPNAFDYLYLWCLLHYCDHRFLSTREMRHPSCTDASPDLIYLFKFDFIDLALVFCTAVLMDCAFVEREVAPLLYRAEPVFPDELPYGYGDDLLRFISGVYRQYQTGEVSELEIGRYKPAFTQWNTRDPDRFADAVQTLFALHRELSHDTEFGDDETEEAYFEFDNPFLTAFPSEILMVYKLRERLGLPNEPSFESLTGLSISYPLHRHEDTGDPNVPRIRHLIQILEEKAPRIPELYGKD